MFSKLCVFRIQTVIIIRACVVGKLLIKSLECPREFAFSHTFKSCRSESLLTGIKNLANMRR